MKPTREQIEKALYMLGYRWVGKHKITKLLYAYLSKDGLGTALCELIPEIAECFSENSLPYEILQVSELPYGVTVDEFGEYVWDTEVVVFGKPLTMDWPYTDCDGSALFTGVVCHADCEGEDGEMWFKIKDGNENFYCWVKDVLDGTVRIVKEATDETDD